ncbi:MAG: TonB-dependent receptor [Gemmatimonadaceae bacterium]
MLHRASPAARVATTCLLAALASALPAAAPATAQQRPTATDSVRDTALVSLGVLVRRDSAGGEPVELAMVRSGRTGAQTDGRGQATLRLPPGPHTVVASKVGTGTGMVAVTLRAGADTTVIIVLVERAAELEGVVVSATRGERRVEDTPLRVEVIDEEEVAEKVAMSPGDIAMMLAETGGLRVQTTSPSLGGASVRVQGLLGRYSLILADGLPLHGPAGGLGLLQIPPVDLGRVEIVKGTASALYGSAALGGVINLVSRRPGAETDNTLLANQTSRGGTDGVFFGSGPLSERWGYTLLAGAHRQQRNDLDDDGWTDMPGYRRAVVRPRFHFDDGRGRTAFVTGGYTAEERDGGTLDDHTAPDGLPYVESLGTRRADAGGLARWVASGPDGLAGIAALRGSILTLRGSVMEQRLDHQFGAVRERDRHRTWFGEAALAAPRGRAMYIVGAAYQRDAHHGADVDAFDYTYAIPSAFGQVDVDPTDWFSLSMSARLDAHSEFGTVVNPRLSLLIRRPAGGALAGWTTRLSAGTGAFAPTPFVEQTEATGLTPLAPLSGLVAERARSASVDVGGPLETAVGTLELNATAFGSRLSHPLQVHPASGTTAGGASMITLVNAAGPTRTWGGELLARLAHELGEEGADGEEPPSIRLTATYTYIRSTECTPAREPGIVNSRPAIAATGCMSRREVPLTPRHAAGMVASIEEEGKSRLGLEIYFTGRQSLDENPYRSESRPYVLLGLLGERAFETGAGVARLFLNLENLTNVRQTRHDPLVLPARGPGGRWTTDAWTEMVGFTMNGGVRLAF